MSLITQFREKDFTKGFNHYNGVFEKTGIYFDILLMEENKKIEICDAENETSYGWKCDLLCVSGTANQPKRLEWEN